MSQLAIETSVAIDSPASAAWEIISDFSRNPEWQNGMRTCTWLTDPPLAVGSRYQQHARFLGRDIVTTFEIIELDGGRSVTIDTIEGTFPITVTRTVAPAGDGCTVTAHVSGTASGFFGLITPLMRPLVKRSVKGDYQRLKRMLET